MGKLEVNKNTPQYETIILLQENNGDKSVFMKYNCTDLKKKKMLYKIKLKCVFFRNVFAATFVCRSISH